MPNLVHSLDATSMVMLLKSFHDLKLKNIYTIHDCFAVTCDNVHSLLDLIKLVYIEIYSKDSYPREEPY